eukprot:7382685-Prymnesium_polylepis.1
MGVAERTLVREDPAHPAALQRERPAHAGELVGMHRAVEARRLRQRLHIDERGRLGVGLVDAREQPLARALGVRA